MPLPVKGNFGGNRGAYTIFRCGNDENLKSGDGCNQAFLTVCLDTAVENGSGQEVTESTFHTYTSDPNDGYTYMAYFGRSWVVIDTWPERKSVEVTFSNFEDELEGATKGVLAAIKEFAEGRRTLCVFDVPTPTADPEPNRPDDPPEEP